MTKARPPDFGRSLDNLLTEDDLLIFAKMIHLYSWTRHSTLVGSKSSLQSNWKRHISSTLYRAFTKFGDQEIPEVREFIDNFPITPTITQEFKLLVGSPK